MRETILEICNMKDPLCSQGVEKMLSAIPGVHHVQTNPINGTTTVKHEEKTASVQALKEKVDSLGLYCHCEALPEHHGRQPIGPETDGDEFGGGLDRAADDQATAVSEPATMDHAAMDHAAEDHAGMDHATEEHAAEDHTAHGGHEGMTMLDMAISCLVPALWSGLDPGFDLRHNRRRHHLSGRARTGDSNRGHGRDWARRRTGNFVQKCGGA